ncbi:MAG: hypothetical protein K2P41_16150 [Lachnospiraceae bacterium]|nr:hypothetical protein [Lachnospiraceae bacterium]
MELIFDFDQRQGLANIGFHGLDGTESVTSIKDALRLLKIRNPAVNFAEAAKHGAYNDVPDAEYKRMLDTITFISELWRYPDEPGEGEQKCEINVLMLLANAIEALSMFNVQCQMQEPQQP